MHRVRHFAMSKSCLYFCPSGILTCGKSASKGKTRCLGRHLNTASATKRRPGHRFHPLLSSSSPACPNGGGNVPESSLGAQLCACNSRHQGATPEGDFPTSFGAPLVDKTVGLQDRGQSRVFIAACFKVLWEGVSTNRVTPSSLRSSPSPLGIPSAPGPPMSSCPLERKRGGVTCMSCV